MRSHIVMDNLFSSPKLFTDSVSYDVHTKGLVVRIGKASRSPLIFFEEEDIIRVKRSIAKNAKE